MRGSGKKMKSRSKRSTYRKTARSRANTILQNANNPHYTSCKYFAAREYYKSFKRYSPDEIESLVSRLTGIYGPSEMNQLPIFEPTSSEAFSRKLTLFFITYLPGIHGERTPIIHGFIVKRARNGFYIYSSWGNSRSCTPEEYEEYSATMYGRGELPVNIENHPGFPVIVRKPTRQGPFTEDELREGLSDVKQNLQMLFGLTAEEDAIERATPELDNIQIQIVKEY